MAWQPQAGPLVQLAQCLRDSLSGHDKNAQKKAEEMLKQAKTSPDINNYLVYLCVTPVNPTDLSQETWHAARSAGAIMLKNNVKVSFASIPESAKQYIKSNILSGLQDPSLQIRNYVGQVITEVVRQGGIENWQQVLTDLVSIAEGRQASPNAQDGALNALALICEDNREKLDQDIQGSRPLVFLIPKILALMGSPEARIRRRALGIINTFLDDRPAVAAQEMINEILPGIVQLTTDEDEEVRRFVCRSFARMADSMSAVLLPHLEGIISYIISQQQEVQNQELALDAAEFFFEASYVPVLRDALGPYLDKIVPVLLDSMIYSEEDQVRLEGDEEDADVEDDEQDIKPQFATAKSSRTGNAEPASKPATANGQEKPAINGYAYEDDGNLSDGEIEEDDDFEVDPEDEWNLRKCSAAALDTIALHYNTRTFEVTLPWLMENLQHQHWQNREAAVLALGAIGPGCLDSIKPHLPQLVPYMLTQLSDEQPVVRKIACWALSRFAGWAAELDDAGKRQFFEPIMDGILQRMLDHSKKVQESAASAFATLEEASQSALTPYCHVILQQFVKCFDRYKDRNIYILYDCIQTLAEHTGAALARPDLVDLLMPALITRWQKVADRSREMFPLLECLAFVATALGSSFSPFAKPIFGRCISIIEQNLEESVNASTDSWLDQPDKDFLVTSLDLVSSIIQVLSDEQRMDIVNSAQPNMFQLLAYCMQDVNNDVKQSAYALLGDCAIYLFEQLQPFLPTILQLIIAQLDISAAEQSEDPETIFRVINNACWSCGEIAMRQGPGMATYIDRLLQQLAIIMFSDKVPQSLNENAAIALGRLGMGCHQQLAPHLQNFALPFLKSMQKVDWTDEKGHAYKGFSQVVLDNPQALENGLLDFFMEIASAPGAFLTSMQDQGPFRNFERVLAEYKRLIGENNFEGFLRNLPPPQVEALHQLYVF